jgi:hypothetical protein
MAATYYDSSALVKRYVVEVGSAWVRRMVARPAHHVLYTAALTEVEVLCYLFVSLSAHLSVGVSLSFNPPHVRADGRPSGVPMEVECLAYIVTLGIGKKCFYWHALRQGCGSRGIVISQ